MLGSNMAAEMGDMAGGAAGGSGSTSMASLASLPMLNYQGGDTGSMMDAPNGLDGGVPKVGGASGAASAVRSGVSGFLNHMFLFDTKTKCDLLNLAQYSLLGVGPTILMLKTIKNYFPNASEAKGTPELALECTLEILFILFCIYYIHRFICYIPTYSQVRYDGVNFTQSVLMFLVILFTIQTKLGTKINILVRRATHVVEGYTSFGGGEEGEREEMPMENSLERMVVSQPLTGGHAGGGGMGMQQPETSFGPIAPTSSPPLVPSSQPGLGGGSGGGGRHGGSGGGGAPHLASDSPSAADAFSSGSLSGTAW